MRYGFGAAIVFAFVVARPASAEEPAFKRTEQRQQCASYSKTRQPYFGELHSHTAYSADAVTLDTRNTPRDAYRFAQGETVGLPPFVNRLSNAVTPPNAPEIVTSHPYCIAPQRCEYTATRSTKMPRPIDFAAITDHSEWLGETNICFFEGTQQCTTDSDCTPQGQKCDGAATGNGICRPVGYNTPSCVLARTEVTRLRGGIGAALFGAAVVSENPQRLPFCDLTAAPGQETCTFQAQNVWQQIISDAEEAYDRSESCSFTSFVAYEYTSMPGMGQCANNGRACFADADCPGSTCAPNSGGGNNLHRNIIFRNANVLANPISYIDVPTGCGKGTDCKHGGALASPVQMLQAVADQCNDGNNCEFISIPHNPNLSGGAMFLAPESVAEAEIRARYEPLAEIMQIKGQSECRYSATHPGAWGTRDEQCDFENMSFAKLTGQFFDDPTAKDIPPNSYLREVLKNGLAYKQANGVDPFHLGFVGATDGHAGTPSNTEEFRYAKDAAHGDGSFIVSGQALNEQNFLGFETQGGGLTVAWAEENSRDSLFAAFLRRETYATSGTRPIVRFFGGFDLPPRMCNKGDFAEEGYEHGVPMGGTLERGKSKRRRGGPTFAVMALKDPGWDRDHQGTPLQKIQIVKGWVDRSGKTHEAVYDVAGDRWSKATVDLRTCEPRGRGYSDLCSQWTDDDFDPNQHAFYYARVIENPSCRWNQYYCLSRGVDCSRRSQANKDIVGYTQFEYDQCCSSTEPKTIQERAWTSPIWYSPEGR